MELEDSLPDCIAEKWEIDAPGLLARLRALPYADELALVAGIEAWWRKQ